MRRGSRKKTIYQVKPDNRFSCCFIITSTVDLYFYFLIKNQINPPNKNYQANSTLIIITKETLS